MTTYRACPKGFSSLRDALRSRDDSQQDVNYSGASTAVGVGLAVTGYREEQGDQEIIEVLVELQFTPLFWTVAAAFKQDLLRAAQEPKAVREEREDYAYRAFAARLFLAGTHAPEAQR